VRIPLHPQVAALLDAAARSALPTLDKVAPFVARRLYAERCKVVMPKKAPEAQTRVLLTPGGVVLRGYRPGAVPRSEPLPALVFFHGGGWTIGDLDTHDMLCRELAGGARCAVFSVEYRLAPESPFPAAVEDCIAATDFVFKNAETLAIQPDRIAVGGDSAGGNLAAVVALHARDAGGPPLCFQLLIYPATDLRVTHPSHQRNGEGYLLTKHTIQYFMDHYLPRREDRADWRASPLLAKNVAGLPAAFILTAGFDPLIDEGREYAERLAKEGNEIAYREYPDMIHGFITFGGVVDTANDAVAECCAKLRNAFALVAA